MIKSMTAFARTEQSREGIFVQATMRSYNARFLDIVFHLPESCFVFEDEIRQILAGIHQRGRIDIKIYVHIDENPELENYQVDLNRASAYYQALSQLSETLGLKTKPGIDQMLTVKDLISPVPCAIDEDLLKDTVLLVVKEAALNLDHMRSREGKNLFSDLSQRICDMEQGLALLEKLAGNIPEIYKKKLEERLTRLLGDEKLPIDPVRLAQEVAVLADKSDVTEEITRLYSHIAQFREILESGDNQGPKLNFLVQEFLREFNTIGSKAGHSDIIRMVVEFKSDLEKIREQVQNIE